MVPGLHISQRHSVLRILMGLVVVSSFSGACGGEQTEAEMPVTDDAGVVRSFEIASRRHVQGRVEYEHTPPVGGDHSSEWQRCGFYSDPIIPERGVHSMEHGAVWITYHPGLRGDDVSRLRRLTRGQDHVLVSRWSDDLPAPLVASAWGRQVSLRTPDDTELRQFIRDFAGGPQAPEQGVSC